MDHQQQMALRAVGNLVVEQVGIGQKLELWVPPINGHKRAAGGVVPFLKIANDIAIAVDQLGCVALKVFCRVFNRSEGFS